MIALLGGHCLKGPGRSVRVLPGAEYDYIRACCELVQARWDSRGFRRGRVIMTPDSEGATPKDASNQSILDRIAICRDLRVVAACELHFNTDRNGRRDDYSLTFYQHGGQTSRELSSHLCGALSSFLQGYGSARWIETGMPDRRWPRKRGAIQDAPYPAVLLEPLFMSNPDHQQFFKRPAALQTFSRLLADALQSFMEVHNVRGQSEQHSGSGGRDEIGTGDDSGGRGGDG